MWDTVQKCWSPSGQCTDVCSSGLHNSCCAIWVWNHTPIYNTHRTWHWMTYSCFQTWRICFMDVDFRMTKTSLLNWRHGSEPKSRSSKMRDSEGEDEIGEVHHLADWVHKEWLIFTPICRYVHNLWVIHMLHCQSGGHRFILMWSGMEKKLASAPRSIHHNMGIWKILGKLRPLVWYWPHYPSSAN